MLGSCRRSKPHLTSVDTRQTTFRNGNTLEVVMPIGEFYA